MTGIVSKAKWASLVLGLGVAASTLAGCASQQTVLLRMQGEQTDALVTINDRYVGKLGEIVRRGIRLPPGPYRITIEKVGYFTYDELVQVQEEPLSLSVKLVPVPD